ncbi:Gfo/Idh/MocA family oxidoreductase [Nonomuraea sp. NPDC026600]|uniref:Gfo/Idh/MocA family protein n=1 Tax=Nonomuraea sp. NPDC026600 TaxID=3155363 RepID=UPI003411BFD5
MNVIILGCGLISGRWIRALTADPRVTVAGLVDSNPDAADAVLRRCGLDDIPAFPDLAAAYKATPDARIVVNLLPPDVHAAASRQALGWGMHVFTEKPLAVTLQEAEALVREARSCGLVLAVMSNRGHDTRFLTFRDLLHATSDGPYAVNAEVFVRLPHPGFRSRLDLPAVADLAVHAFDQIGQLIRADPLTVTCVETPLPALGSHRSVACATIQFADGSVFTFRGGYCGTGQRTSADGYWRIDTPDGGLRWDGANTAVVIRDTHPDEPDVIPLPASDGHAPRITAMVDAVHGGPKLPDGLDSIALLDAALHAARTGSVTSVGQVQR